MLARTSFFTALFLCIAGLASGASLKVPEYGSRTLDNGLRVQLMQHATVPMVYFELWIAGGSAVDPAGKEGLASLTADALRKGAGERDANSFAETLDFLGASYSSDVDVEKTRIRLNLQARDFDLGLQLLADVVRRPRLEDEEIEKLRAQAAEGISQAKENPRNVLSDYHAAHLFGEHAYGRPTRGTEESLPGITADDVRAYHRDQFGADRAILTVVGDIDVDHARQRIAETFGNWAAANTQMTPITAPEPAPGPRVLVINKNDTPQTWFIIGTNGPTWHDLDDYAATEIVRTVFGGRFTSWLNQKLRIEEGLTYGARYGIDRWGVAGLSQLSTFTATETTERAIDLALEQLDRLHETGLTEADLESAKAYLRGQMPYQYETAGGIARAISQLAFYGIDRSLLDGMFAAIDAVTLEDCAAAAQRWVHRDGLVFTAIGVASEIEELMAKYGPVTVRQNTDPGFGVDGLN